MNSDQGGEPLQEEAEPGLKARGEAEPGPGAREERGAAEPASMVSLGLILAIIFPFRSMHGEMINEHLKKACVEKRATLRQASSQANPS